MHSELNLQDIEIILFELGQAAANKDEQTFDARIQLVRERLVDAWNHGGMGTRFSLAVVIGWAIDAIDADYCHTGKRVTAQTWGDSEPHIRKALLLYIAERESGKPSLSTAQSNRAKRPRKPRRSQIIEHKVLELIRKHPKKSDLWISMNLVLPKDKSVSDSTVRRIRKKTFT